MAPLSQTRSILRDVAGAEQRLNRAVATGKSVDKSVSVQLGGNGKVKSIELDGAAHGLTDEQAAELGEAFAQAFEAALAKQGRRVTRELQGLKG